MNVYEIVTNRIIEKLEAGVAPWRKPWTASASLGAHSSFITKKPYRGINAFLTAVSGFESPYWLTFKQVKELGGSVIAGSKSTPIVYFNKVEKENAQGEKSEFAFLRYYSVFNVEQTTGIDYPKPETPTCEFEPIESAAAIIRDTQLRSEIRHGGAQAFYSPKLDVINMPIPQAFERPEGYYSTLFHEMTHATGHTSRLDRGLDAPAAFGTPDYSKEELVAEMGAAFLCAQARIVDTTLDNSAAYLAGWIKVLKGNPKLLVSAAAQGQKAADYILNKKES